jgi:hypothetical protein
VGRNSPRPLACGAVVCGDGVAEGAEECDDANTSDGDGCSQACTLEDASALCAGTAAVAGTDIASVLFATGLSTVTHIAAPPLDPNRVFLVERIGRVRIVKNGTLLATPFLDIRNRTNSAGERGLFSIAFHPDFESNGRFFVNYTNTQGDTVIARYEAGANPDEADESSERIVLTIDQPFDNHNGGQLAFDPAGYLYVGMGDGGSQGDPQENGQTDTTLLAKLLRLDVNVETPPYYAVPPSNPNFAAGDPLGLVWAKGLRNPWRFSFDRLTGDLYIGDVGGNQREEISFTPAPSPGGENYGWNVFQGTLCHNPLPHYPDCPNPPLGFTMPVLEYTHSEGCAVIGGAVYRGCRLPDLHGTYFYGDLCGAFIRTFEMSGGMATNHDDRTADLKPSTGVAFNSIISFGEDARGELYVSNNSGRVFKIVPAP